MSHSSRRTLLVVVHTHWDREWYHHAARFRQRLVALIDAVVANAAPNALPLLLDGQTIVLEDYLSVRPDGEPTINAALGTGRIAAGPWYVLADLLIPMGESLVRNLFAGRRMLSRRGAKAPRVLYAPDAFGHPAYLPTLAAGFDFPVTVLWRGYGGARWPASDTARWRARDGSETLLVHLPPDGYEFGSSLPVDQEEMRVRVDRIDQVLRPRANTRIALLTVGADHHAVDPHLPTAIEALRAHAGARGWDVVPLSLQDAATRVSAATATVELPSVTGELRESCGYTWALQGTFATRSNQKRRHAQLERRLLDDVEPLAALAWFAQATPERAPAGDGTIEAHQLPVLLDAVWRDLLTCHPHDTLCGCSTDAVARAMDARLDAVEAQLDGLAQAALDLVLGHDRVAARRAVAQWRPQLVLRNRVGSPRAGLVEIELVRPIADEPVGPRSGPVTAVSEIVPPVPAQLDGLGAVQSLKRCLARERLESPLHYPDNDRVVVDHLLAWCVSPVPALGIRTVAAIAGSATDIPVAPSVRAHEPTVGSVTLENSHLRVEITEFGVHVRDQHGNWSANSLLRLIDEDDQGDSYTPEPTGVVREFAISDVTLRHAGPLRASAVATLRTTGIVAELEVSLDADAYGVGLMLRGVNGHDDHRLRLLLTCDGSSTRTIADSGFGVIARENASVPADEQREESVIHAAPLHRWVATPEGRATVVVSDGIPEYERLDDGTLALTVLRATGALSRNSLQRRRGHAGWPIDIPDAQQHGAFVARCWLMRLPAGTAADDIAAAAARHADATLRPLVANTLRDAITSMPDESMLTLERGDVTLSSIKPSEDRQSLIVRVQNNGPTVQCARLHFGMSISRAMRARLDETPLLPVPVVSRCVEIDVGPFCTETILVTR
jgi:mannosylglycerate hydrolase